MPELTDEQRGLRDAIRALLTKRSDSAAVRRAVEEPAGYDTALWQVLCEQIGVAALDVPEQYGGMGAGLREIQLVTEELGRALTPAPMLAHVLAVALVRALDDDEAAARLLPRIAAGETAAVAWATSDGRWERGAFEVVDGRLTGEAHFVLDGDTAELMLAVADGAVYEVDAAGADRARTPTMDITRPLSTVRLDDVAAKRIGPADATGALQAALDEAVVALAGEQVGAAAAAFAMTVDYAKVRQQFGRQIGSFQALKHRMADLHVLLEAARSAAYAAADGAVSPSVAKAYCSQALHAIAAETIQLHGGIAITWEHDAHLYFKRAHSTAALFGSPAAHVAKLTQELA